MRVTFVLPEVYFGPIGGYKVVYQYANELVARGHTVHVVFPLPRFQPWNTYMAFDSLAHRVRRAYVVPLLARLVRGRLRPRWFPLDRRVRVHYAREIASRYLPPADAIVATAWQTAQPVADCAPASGRKFYLIQHYEGIFQGGDQEAVDASFRLPLHKIVIARWLAGAVEDAGGGTSEYLPNGLDMKDFAVREPIEAREAASVLMLYHRAEWKGCADGLAALERVRQQVPDLRATFFSVYERPAELPDWIEFHRTPPDLPALYNRHALFLHPSWAEGAPAPPAEAMLCGCAVVAAANSGVREYITDGQTGLLSPVKDPQALAENLLRLIREDPLRRQLASQGHDHIRQFTWGRAADRLLEILGDASLVSTSP